MNTLERCCLITLRFDSELGLPMTLCGAFSVDAMRKELAEAFSHPLLATLDESARFERLAHSIERDLLSEAGVALVSRCVKQENFVVEGRDEPVSSLWLDLDLTGSANARKARVIESALRAWLERVFPGAYCSLPCPRPIPYGTDDDLAALRAGWRAEAAARGFSPPPARESMSPTPESAN